MIFQDVVVNCETKLFSAHDTESSLGSSKQYYSGSYHHTDPFITSKVENGPFITSQVENGASSSLISFLFHPASDVENKYIEPNNVPASTIESTTTEVSAEGWVFQLPSETFKMEWLAAFANCIPISATKLSVLSIIFMIVPFPTTKKNV